MKYILLMSSNEADRDAEADLPKPDLQASFAFKGRVFTICWLGLRRKEKKSLTDVENGRLAPTLS
jgi:hypothetical protein